MRLGMAGTVSRRRVQHEHILSPLLRENIPVGDSNVHFIV
jgi:hypothetical protein